ncbi:MAG: hypothetical protein ABIZ91_07060 [Gemmatimonadaceae bacterium]
MFGCFRTIGCLVVAAAAGVGAYATRDMWLPRVTGREAPAPVTFQEVTTERGERATRRVESLDARSGPAFINLSAAEVAALVLAKSGTRLPAIVSRGEAAVEGDQLVLRALVDLSGFRGIAALGPLSSLLGTRQRVTLSGGLEVMEPGRAQFLVREVKVGDFLVPPPAIGPLLAQLDRGPREAGVAPNGLAFAVPRYVGDVRVGKGQVTLYKSAK